MMRRSSATTIATLLLVAASVLAIGLRGAVAADSLNGVGESWPGPAVDKIRSDATTAVGSTPSFISRGETEGRADLAAGDADFAVTSVGLSATDTQTATDKGRTIAYAPYMAGAVAVVVALDIQAGHGGGRITKLNLTVPTLAKIYTHQITQWVDPEITGENPTETNLGFLKQPQIVFVARKDTSSSTAALISLFLNDAEARPIWNAYATSPGQGAKADTALDAWPSDADSHADLRTDGAKGVMDRMLGLNPDGTKIPQAESHHIGYVSPSWVKLYNDAAPMVTLISKDAGHTTKIDPTPESVTKAMNKATFDPATNLPTLNYKLEADGAWPIPMISYFAVPTKGLPAAKIAPLSNLVKFALNDAGQKDVTDTNYVPVSAALKIAGLKVADAIAAQTPASGSATTTSTAAAGGATTTSTSSPTSTTSASGGVTAYAVGSSSGSSTGSDPNGSGTSSSASGASGASTAAASPAAPVSAAVDPPTLPATGRAVVPTALAALFLVVAGESARRRVRTRAVITRD